jgi:membrane protein YdbS with pleckstrin-like domain
MTKNIWTILGVILAVVIAWWLVSALFSVLWFIAKLAIVAVVAVVVFLVIRSVFTRADD